MYIQDDNIIFLLAFKKATKTTSQMMKMKR